MTKVTGLRPLNFMKLIIRLVCFFAAAVCFGMGIDFVMSGLGLCALTAGAFGGGTALATAGLLVKPKKSEFAEELQGLEGANAQMMQARFNKAVEDFNYLSHALNETNTPALKGTLIQLQNTSHKMISYLERNPRQIAVADKFINYYQESAVSLVKQYLELEQSGIDSPSAAKTKSETLATLRNFQQAYQEQFEKMMEEHMMSMNAEVSVARYAMKEDGIDVESEVVNDDPFTKNSHYQQNNNGNFRAYSYSFDNSENNTNQSTGIFGKIKNKIQSMAINALQNAIKRQFQPPGSQPADNSFKGRVLSVIGDIREWGIFYFDKNYPLQDISKIKKYRYIISVSSIIFGCFGAQYFLMGKTFKGLLSLLFCWTPLPTFWGIYKGITYIMMDDQEFYYRYYLSKFNNNTIFF